MEEVVEEGEVVVGAEEEAGGEALSCHFVL